MPVTNRFADFHQEITAWRRDFHEHPELLYDVHRTAEKIAGKLTEFGVDEVVTGLGKTGVVGVIKGRSTDSGKVIGLRADMDALPIHEATDKPYASKTEGKMHACGHDGHTSMLLGAAKYLAETRNFDGTIILIFQPAEEGGAGAKAMIDDGLMDRFGIQQVFGMHNMPGAPVGDFSIRTGAIMASADRITIDIEGKGSHAAMPNDGVDTVLVMAAIIQAVQQIASRNVDPLESVVVSLCKIRSGFTDNVLPQTAQINGTVRTLNPEVRDLAEKRLHEIIENTAKAYGATAKLTYRRDYPVTVNHDEQTDFVVSIAESLVGKNRVNRYYPPTMGAEDFSFMLESRPGAFIFVGNGDTASLHHPEYDFNDDLIPIGCSYWAQLAETAMPVS